MLAVLSFAYVCMVYDARYFCAMDWLAVWTCEWLFLHITSFAWIHICAQMMCMYGWKRSITKDDDECVACAAERMNINILHGTHTNKSIDEFGCWDGVKIIMVHRYDIFTNTIAQKTTAHSVSHRHFDETSKKWIERKQRYHNNKNNNNKWMLRLHKNIQNFDEFHVGFNGDFLILFKYFNKHHNLLIFKHFEK